jgi:hypothetical protein
MSDSSDRDYEDEVTMKLAAKIDAAADYVRRGRVYCGLTDVDLTSAWIAAFKDLGDNFGSSTGIARPTWLKAIAIVPH